MTLILILIAHAALTASLVQAAAITVTSKLDTPDPGNCTLRDAITAANTNTATGDCPAGSPGMDTIGFSLGLQCSLVPCTIPLTSALPTVTEDLTFNGSNTVISGEHAFRVFDLGAVTVNMSNMRISNGNSADFGGAINMSDAIAASGTTLTLNNVFFSGNHAVFGGAIYQPRGTLTITNSNFSGNTAGSGGGAILEERTGSVITVAGTSFSGNTAVGGGGAMALVSEATVLNCTFTGNSAAFGGAIAKLVLGNLAVNDSVFNNNVSTGTTPSSGGGAIYIFQTVGTASLTNVTLSGNSAANNGGGILASAATTNLNNMTIANNTADSDNNGVGNGGGILNDAATTKVQNSIIAANFDTPGNAGVGTIIPDCSGTFSSQGYNLIGRNDGCVGFVNGVNADKVGNPASPIDPLLAALANNGGPTLTHAILPGSPGFNAGNPLIPGSGGFACAGADQRGVSRPQGSTCDIGAFEFESRGLYLPLLLK